MLDPYAAPPRPRAAAHSCTQPADPVGSGGGSFERDLVAACVRHAHFDPNRFCRLAAAAGNWHEVVSRAEEHDLAPLLYWRLSQTCAEAAPPDILEGLKAGFHENARRNLSLAGEMLRVLGLFERAGIPVFAFKGATLAWSVWENPGLRSFLDLDLMVHPADRARSVELMQASGYRAQLGITHPAFLRQNPQIPFISAEGFLIEVHWGELFHGCGDVWSRLTPVTVAGRGVAAPGRDDMLIYACVHGARHVWGSLRWLCDLVRLLESGECDWEAVLRRSRAAGCDRRVLLGVLLSRELGNVELPGELLKRIGQDPKVAALARKVEARLAEQSVNTRSEVRFELAAFERWSDKARYGISHFHPTPADFESLRISPRLVTAYYLARPFRLAAKHLRRRFRRGQSLT